MTDENARYSILNDRKQIFAAKYLTFMPTEDELRREIEQQKLIFLEQKKSDWKSPELADVADSLLKSC